MVVDFHNVLVHQHFLYRLHLSASGMQQESATYFLNRSVMKTTQPTFEISLSYRFRENRDVILHVKPMGKIHYNQNHTKIMSSK